MPLGRFILCFIAERIHLSESTKNILTELGGYHLQSRGLIGIKVIYFIGGAR